MQKGSEGRGFSEWLQTPVSCRDVENNVSIGKNAYTSQSSLRRLQLSFSPTTVSDHLSSFSSPNNLTSVPVETELYELLGVPPNASQSESHAWLNKVPSVLITFLPDDIKKAYRKKVRGHIDSRETRDLIIY